MPHTGTVTVKVIPELDDDAMQVLRERVSAVVRVAVTEVLSDLGPQVAQQLAQDVREVGQRNSVRG